MADVSPGMTTSQFEGATAMGPVHGLAPPDLFGAGEAPNDVRYALSPRERDAWQFSVDQAGQVIGQCAAAVDASTVAAAPFDGPYDAGTAQPGVPMYGLAGS